MQYSRLLTEAEAAEKELQQSGHMPSKSLALRARLLHFGIDTRDSLPHIEE
jgi:hypothetical protein